MFWLERKRGVLTCDYAASQSPSRPAAWALRTGLMKKWNKREKKQSKTERKKNGRK